MNGKVTMLNDLMDLEGMNQSGNNPILQRAISEGPPQDLSFVNKFIRDTSNKGMGKYEEMVYQPNSTFPPGTDPRMMVNNNHPQSIPQPIYQSQPPQGMPIAYDEEIRLPYPKGREITCIEISNHIKDCPVCSKLYKHDTTIHIIIIVLLALVTLILLKRVMESH